MHKDDALSFNMISWAGWSPESSVAFKSRLYHPDATVDLNNHRSTHITGTHAGNDTNRVNISRRNPRNPAKLVPDW